MLKYAYEAGLAVGAIGDAKLYRFRFPTLGSARACEIFRFASLDDSLQHHLRCAVQG
jgi:hypothetical protein